MKRTPFNERGAIGGVEGLAFGVLIFVFGTLIVVDAWGVVDAKMATSAAAREASRAFVEADSATDANDRGVQAATQALLGHNRTPDTILFHADRPGGAFGRCQPITASVSTRVPRVPIPFLDRRGGSYTVTSRHSEIVDPYRSGLAGSADC